jgi:Ser/Thr protein kinase RdoA (MazF antagonist)
MAIDNAILRLVLDEYDASEQATLQAFGTGLINNTWVVNDGGKKFILQRINDNVFKQPEDIAFNIDLIANYLKNNSPGYKFTSPIASGTGDTLIHTAGEGYFRMFLFVEDSHTIDVVETPQQAYEAAVQFGRFTRVLNGFEVAKLKITIPDFHNLSLRHQQFLNAIENGNSERKEHANDLIKELLGHSSIVEEYKKVIADKNFVKRVTHHDTKISNVLFDKNNKGICVIDLDTVMPGYFISDVGDMMRTYLSPVSEEEKDFSKIIIRKDLYKAIVDGYYKEMKEVLTRIEKEHFFYSGCFMIYMQALRFLTDYLNNDIYYGEKYPGHNFVRAGNQSVLLQRLLDKRKDLGDPR